MCDVDIQPEITSPKGTEIVADFGTLPKDELQAIVNRLGLHISPARLTQCATMYRTMRRSPSVGELRFLDILLSTARADLTHATLCSWQTTDAATAEVFSDLVEQCKTAQGHTPPLSPAVALEAIYRSATDRGVSSPLADTTTGERFCLTSEQELAALPLQGQTPQQSVRIPQSPWYLSTTLPGDSLRATTLATGDFCSLLTPPEDAQSPTLPYTCNWLAPLAAKRRVLRFCPVTGQSLLPILLSLADGWYADLSAIHGLSERAPADAAIALPCGYLICADEENTKTLMEQAQAQGWQLSAFARVTTDRSLTLATHDSVNFSIPTSYLRELTRPPSVEVSLTPALHDLTILPEYWKLGQWSVAHLPLSLSQPLALADITTALSFLIDNVETTELCLAVGICAGNDASAAAIWSSILSLRQALRDYPIPLIKPAIITRPSEQSALSLCLLAQSPATSETLNEAPTDKTSEKAEDEALSAGENP